MGRRITARLLAVAVPGAPGAALLLLAPPDQLAAAWRTGLHAHDGGSALLLATTAVVAWAVVGWLALGLVLTVLGAVPGVVGATARGVGRRATPALLRSLLSGGTAVGLALTPALTTVAAHASPACAPSPGASALPSLDRPEAACGAPLVTSATAPLRPPTTAPTPSSPPPTPATTAPAPSPAPTTRSPVRAPSGAHPPAPRASRTVRAGDTLWSLAGAELRAAGRPATDAAVAQRWPAWWQANRAEIGADPGLLHPGEVLQAPAALTHRETP